MRVILSRPEFVKRSVLKIGRQVGNVTIFFTQAWGYVNLVITHNVLWSLSVDFGRPTFAIMSGHLQPSFWPDYLFIVSHGSYHVSYISSYSQRMISLTAVWICAIRQFPLFTGFDSYGMHWISLGCHAFVFFVCMALFLGQKDLPS